MLSVKKVPNDFAWPLENFEVQMIYWLPQRLGQSDKNYCEFLHEHLPKSPFLWPYFFFLLITAGDQATRVFLPHLADWSCGTQQKKPPSCWFYLSNFFQHLVIVLIEIFHNFSQNSFSWTWQRSPREPVSFFLSSFNLDMLELIWVDYSAYLLIIMLLRKKYKWLFLEIFI